MQKKLDIKKIGLYFKRIREEFDYSIKEFSKLLCVSQKQLLLVEEGKRLPNLEMVIRCSNAFNICADNFLIFVD